MVRNGNNYRGTTINLQRYTFQTTIDVGTNNLTFFEIKIEKLIRFVGKVTHI